VSKILTRAEWEASVAEAWSKAIESGLRETVAQWMIERGYATGHGDTVEDLLKELEWQIREREREEWAKVAELVAREIDDTNGTATYIAKAIRARGNTGIKWEIEP
jgi:hypothetical protein